MSVQSDLRRVGQRSLMVWIPADLHKAFRMKLAEDDLTMSGAIIWMLTKYTQFKREENGKSVAESTPESPKD